jgi:hypothetical protein
VSITIERPDLTILLPERAPFLYGRDEARKALQLGMGRGVSRHFKGPLEATRDFGVHLLMAFQGSEAFDAPPSPWIAMLGDDMGFAIGPDAFGAVSLDRLILDAERAVIVSSGPEPHAYNVAATHAARDRRNCILIETLPPQVEAWKARFRAVRGKDDLPTLFCVPAPSECAE